MTGSLNVSGAIEKDLNDGDLTMGANITMADDTSIGISDSAERIKFDGYDISFLGFSTLVLAPIIRQSC